MKLTRLNTLLAVLVIVAGCAVNSIHRTVRSPLTWHVSAFGNSLQGATDNAIAGDTVHCDGIVQTVTFTPKSGVNYVADGAQLTSPGKAAIFSFADGSHDVLITGFTFHGRVVYAVPAGNQFPSRILITHNSFAGNLYDGYDNATPIWAIGWDSSLIAYNEMTAWGDGNVMTFGGHNLVIASNHIYGCNEGVHLSGNGPNNGGVSFVGNWGGNCARIWCEIQGAWGNDPGVIVLDNDVNGARVDLDPHNCMALSIATDGAIKVVVDRNHIKSYERIAGINNGVGMVIAIELASSPTVAGALECTGNFIDGTNAAIAMQTSLGAHVHDNIVRGSLGGIQKNSCVNPNPDWSTTNGPQDGATPTLTWSADRQFPLAQYASLDGSPAVTTTVGASPQGTAVPPATSLTDASGNTWTLAGGRAVRNAVTDQSTHDVTALLLFDKVYEQTPTGFYRFDAPSWVLTADPRPATQPATQPTTSPTTQPATEPTTAPTTQPILTHTIGVYSDGSVKLDGK